MVFTFAPFSFLSCLTSLPSVTNLRFSYVVVPLVRTLNVIIVILACPFAGLFHIAGKFSSTPSLTLQTSCFMHKTTCEVTLLKSTLSCLHDLGNQDRISMLPMILSTQKHGSDLQQAIVFYMTFLLTRLSLLIVSL